VGLGRFRNRLCQRQPSEIIRRRLRLTRRCEERALVAAQWADPSLDIARVPHVAIEAELRSEECSAEFGD